VTGTISHFTTYGVFSQAPTPNNGGGDLRTLGGSAAGAGAAGSAAGAPGILAPTNSGYSPTAVTLSHDTTGAVSQDYTLETDPSAGFSSALAISKGTQVLSGAGKPLNQISVTPLPSSSVSATLTQGGNTYAFSGYAVDGEPTGAQFVGGNTTVSFTLNQSQWATALGQVDGNTGAMTIETYNNVSKTWTPVTTAVNTNSYTVSAQITHFTVYALYYQGATPQAVTTPTSGQQAAPTKVAADENQVAAGTLATTTPSPQTTPGTGDQGVVGGFVQWIHHLVGGA
jgi:hypothetical protein